MASLGNKLRKKKTLIIKAAGQTFFDAEGDEHISECFKLGISNI